MKPQIHLRLIVDRSDDRDTDVYIEVSGEAVTQPMLDAAEDLRHALSTGERRLPEDLYDAIGAAFFATRETAKKRLLAVMYGKKEYEPLLEGRTWRWHLVQVLEDVREARWIRASRLLALMLRHTLDDADGREPSVAQTLQESAPK